MHDLSLEGLAYDRLVRSVQGRSIKPKLIKFRAFFAKICPTFCLTKRQAWSLARLMQAEGLIEIVPFRGIRLLQRQ